VYPSATWGQGCLARRLTAELVPGVPRGFPFNLARFWHEHFIPTYRRAAMVSTSLLGRFRCEARARIIRTVDDVRDGVIGVWRVGWSGRLMGYVLAAGPACGALSTWLGALSHLDAQSAGSAGIATAVVMGFGQGSLP
jgi:hypothetical protein